MRVAAHRKAFELLREVQSRGEKALVFSQFTTFLDVVEEALQVHMPTLRFCRLDGSTIVEERQRLVDGFNQTEECTAFLLSTKAGGQGLNLTAARTVILLDQVCARSDGSSYAATFKGLPVDEPFSLAASPIRVLLRHCGHGYRTAWVPMQETGNVFSLPAFAYRIRLVSSGLESSE